MNSTDIRNKFLSYFSERGHTVVPSSSLVPEKDPTLLFVNAGMVQFKNLFLGIEKRDYARATSSQKCVRAGGKHNDLENIGKTLRHHTFFEMLGNFSFGDYFKKEAIAYGWEFLTGVLGLDKGKLWVTVYKDDDEAWNLWRAMGVEEDRIVRLGEKDNFWSMGDEGPCGPCSEIIYDLGPEVGCRLPTCRVGCDCDRYLEIWNLVFMEFDRSRDGTMKKLPRPSIDTGMGLERITSVMEGKIGNYDTDLFVPLLRRLEEVAGCSYGENEETDTAMRVIVDHARGATFIINDGVLPSKDGRGYVLRRIIRRALRHGKKLGIEKEFLHDLSATVVDVMAPVFPEVRNNHPFIAGVIRGEEERFVDTLSGGMRSYEEISRAVREKGDRVIPGDLVYKLYDTFGFPLDITMEMAEEDGLTVDMEGFERASLEQKERSRQSSKIKGETLEEGHVAVLKEGISSDFLGYGTLCVEDGRVLSLVKGDGTVEELAEGEEGEVFVDRTPFYAESGGQMDDRGEIVWPGGAAAVTEVKKVKQDLFSHAVTVKQGVLKKGQAVELKVDEERRKGTARNHTATHLLHFALRRVLGNHVKQSGSRVDHERLRFDFTHFQALDDAELARVEDLVNEKILGAFDVVTEERSREEAVREGAMALFEEKYGDTVRVVQVGGFSLELCGGTHVSNTGEIGSFHVISEGSLASGVRRIEAVTGRGALAHVRRLEGTVRAVAKATGTEVGRVRERVEDLVEELRQRDRELARLKEDLMAYRVEAAVKESPEREGARIVTLFVPDAKADDLRRVTDIIRDKAKSCVAVVASRDDLKGMIIAAVTKDLQGKYSAGAIVKKLAEKYGGRGGGGPQIAQGGVPGDKVAEALKSVEEVLDNRT